MGVYLGLPGMATWRSGDAADCKSAYPGSIPGVASILTDGAFRKECQAKSENNDERRAWMRDTAVAFIEVLTDVMENAKHRPAK